MRRARYVLARLHKGGGLGRIWLARDDRLNREVALKELLPDQARNPEARQRFLKEAQITGQLEHPNIVPIYELGNRAENDRPFYTMRFLRGKTLRDAIAESDHERRRGRSDPLELRRLLGAFVSVCHAIAYAHFRGVVHRDLKPENIVLGDFGQVVLLDWGLAKLLGGGDALDASAEASAAVSVDADESTATRAGAVMGTPAYMAPEQAEGRGDLADERTDIYGLGAVLFVVLTGQPPHAGKSSEEVIKRIARGETRRPRQVDPAVPPALDAMCSKAMATEPSERYATATELADDIERWLADEPVSVYRERLGVRLSRWARRHRNWVYAAIGVIVAGVVVSTFASVRLQRFAERESRARVAAERLREQGIRGAAKFAARTVASEIDLRWQILQREAADPELRRMLLALEGADPIVHPERPSLEAWVEVRRQNHSQTTKATSWFVTDARGSQLARHPFSAKTLGRSFAFRDYFHGGGRDMTRAEAAGVGPIRSVHRSIVFESQATGNLMVAFSVPVWNGDSVLGVLAMTVELGRFGELELRFSDDQVAVLIDTKKDWRGREGRILHHPLAERYHSAGRALYLDASRTTALRELRALHQRHERVEPLAGSLELEYIDPADDTGAAWIAAFEPVFVKGRPAQIRDTGWMVVMQERYQPVGSTDDDARRRNDMPAGRQRS